MTRKIHGAAWLAAGALLMISATVAAQAPATQTAPAKETSTLGSLTTLTEEDIQLLRADIRAKRKSVIAANISLTPEEATRFWPLYDQYVEEVKKINDKRIVTMREFVANYKTLTDAQAKDHMEKSAAVDAELIALRTKYLPEFGKLVSPKKVAQFYEMDRRLDLFLNLQLASLVPIVQAK